MSSGKYGVFDLVWALPALAFTAAAYEAEGANACRMRIQELDREKGNIVREEQNRKEQSILAYQSFQKTLEENLQKELDQEIAGECKKYLSNIHSILLPFLLSTAFDSGRMEEISKYADRIAADQGREITERVSDLRKIEASMQASLPKWTSKLKYHQSMQDEYIEILSDINVLNKIMGKVTLKELEWKSGTNSFVIERLKAISILKSSTLKILKEEWVHGDEYIHQQEDALKKVIYETASAFSRNGLPLIENSTAVHGVCTYEKALFRLTCNTAVEISVSSSGSIGYEVVVLKNEGLVEDLRESYYEGVEKFMGLFPRIETELKQSIGLQIKDVVLPSDENIRYISEQSCSIEKKLPVQETKQVRYMHMDI